jgi:endonuclease YncB( thermonuclease family)
MRALLVLSALLFALPAAAGDVVVRDGRTLQIGSTSYRLAGIDTPDMDQICLNDRADPWACGVGARDALAKLIGERAVSCRDLGPDPSYKARRLGACTIQGETVSLGQQMVQQGFAINVPGKDRFAGDEAKARIEHSGLWRGCFAAPQSFRRWDRDAVLLGASCRDDKRAETVELLFPARTTMPPGCPIKGKFARRARLTGNVGVYHLQGCRSYAGNTKPDRWFCSEDDAKAAGFRRAYNCRAGAGN